MKIAATKELTREAWLRLRKQGIGGSDAGAVCGVNPYRSAFAVYMDKTSPDIDTEDSERLRQGRDLEDYCARRFMEASGLKVRRTNFLYRHDTLDFMLADIDRVVVGENAGLECKTASAWMADKWKSLDTVPESYLLQCQHYMAVMGFDHMYLACVILGSGFVYYRIERDEGLISNLIQVERAFWENNVQAHVMPDPDGSRACDELLSGLYPNRSAETIPLIGFDEQLERRKELTALIAGLETEKKAIDHKLKLYLQEHEAAENSRFRVTWKYSEATGTRRFTVREAA